MLSDRLKAKELFETVDEHEKLFAKRVLCKAVRKLVLAMRGIETEGVLTQAEIEDCVIEALEHAELIYMKMSQSEIETEIDKELSK